jgi:hypothetical protein
MQISEVRAKQSNNFVANLFVSETARLVLSIIYNGPYPNILL